MHQTHGPATTTAAAAAAAPEQDQDRTQDQDQTQDQEEPAWHRVRRPHWNCATCGDPYPCAPARTALTDLYAQDLPGLAMLMASDLHEAIKDLWRLHPDGPPETVHELFDRFVGWTRQPGMP